MKATGPSPGMIVLVFLRRTDDAEKLAESYGKAIKSSYGATITHTFVRPDEWDDHYLDIGRIKSVIEHFAGSDDIVMIFEHNDELPSILAQLKPTIDTYVRTQDFHQWKAYHGVANVAPIMASNLEQFAADIFTHIQSTHRSMERAIPPRLSSATAPAIPPPLVLLRHQPRGVKWRDSRKRRLTYFMERYSEPFYCGLSWTQLDILGISRHAA